eukprot:CAMPEP_0202474308 /NCGR_PEP_ID=MMETSP1360-20130828/92312_1 /ASSEMBLY_ACC=CAM_ASM_000848 /TAXON_ID=515479 /ORGANISM="Licmophora paradoxa, Strain CCMP2313" /LENGTH=136 /DNA_ID=CAMNT_0049101423 /DNA_START=1627 /DNA_END=2034 /DNA_ORIENTATION=+
MESSETRSSEVREEEEEEKKEEEEGVIGGNDTRGEDDDGEEVPAPNESLIGANASTTPTTSSINNDAITCEVVLPAALVVEDESSASCDILSGDVVDIDKNKFIQNQIVILICFLFGIIGLIVFAAIKTKKSTAAT